MSVSQNEFFEENTEMKTYSSKEIGNRGEKYAENIYRGRKAAA